MSVETHLLVPIMFNAAYRTKWEVKDALDECNENIEFCKRKLHNLAVITEPTKYMSEGQDPLLWINTEFEETWKWLQDELWDKMRLQYLYSEWDNCHIKVKDEETGRLEDRPVTIPPQLGNCIWAHAYYAGDYLNEVFPDGTKVPEDYYMDSDFKKYIEDHKIEVVDKREHIWSDD